MRNKIVVFASLLAAMLVMTGIASAPQSTNPAGNCPDFNGIGSAAPPISPTILGYVESGTNIRTISVVTSGQNVPTLGNIIPGVITICKYPLDSTGIPDTTIVSSQVSIYGNPLWANDIACGSNDCVRFGRTNGDGNGNNIPIDGGTYPVGSITFSTQPASEIIVAHINWPAICGSYGTCFRTLSPSDYWIPEFPSIALPIAAILGLVFFFQQRKKRG